ncbi:DUF5117 domain-containing protein [Pseudoduganella sp. FT93W]|uniref:DUF5117 domain-containing protein n=1 Tax=Duganella fentianensis TaxID=2692177 RepID=A0A845HRX3_9BURK|nr:zinc-dependent metalloprotease [Duganella fentianensis]MYN43740.1 DUF5117 domain-containing protein [Duganella fentianensis]
MFVVNSLRAAVLLTLGASALAQEPVHPQPAPAPHAPEAQVAPAAVPAAPATPAAMLAALQTPPGARPFADIVRGAAHVPGFLGLYQKEEKVWIELRPDQFDRPLFMSVNTPNGIGERGIYGGQMGMSQVVVFHRVGPLVQLIAKNTAYGAKAGTPQALAVAQAYSDSLLAIAPVISGPHPQNGAILIEASTLLFGDMAAYGTKLETAFRLPYSADARNSSFQSLRSDDSMTGLQVQAHYLVPRLPAAPATAAAAAAAQASGYAPPTTLPDARSLFLGFYYNFMPLPAQPMAGRPADERIGHFVRTSHDFSDDVTPTTAVHLVERWRLEKLDPALPLSAPRQPIVYWIDANVPHKYRESVRQGVLAWNAAFEKIGFKDAIVVKQQSETDRFDTMDARHASVRWFFGNDVGFSLGPRQVDPRSGEILDADIAVSDVFARGARRQIASAALAAPEDRCQYQDGVTTELEFAMGLLSARSETDMAGPEAEALAQAYVRAVVMHEIGHTLGLRHNFRASTVYSLQQLQDPEFTRQHGMAGSVMDYTPFNLALKGETQGEYVPSALGPYDYWAIEYAYKPIAAAQEKEELARIAARSGEPELSFGSDLEAGGFNADPEVNSYDLGSDPLAYVQRRLAMSRELWDRLERRTLKPGESFDSLRRSFENGYQQYARTLPLAVKYIGGVSYVHDHAGTGRAAFTPVPLARQRAALQMITGSLFKADSLHFSPALVSRLTPEPFEMTARPDVSVAARVLALQTAALDQLMADAVATRLTDSLEKLEDKRQVLSLDELYGSLQNAIWSELKSGKEITAARRNLQREHLKRLCAGLLRSPAPTLADARSLQRQYALQLQRDLRAAQSRNNSSKTSREVQAHLAEAYETLSQTLKAPLLRTGT